MNLSPRIQILIEPQGMKTLDETAISLPEELADALRSVFSFKDMGMHEFEGGAFFNALRAFYLQLQAEEVCQIAMYVSDDDLHPLRIVCPIKTAPDAALFVRDQLSSTPQIFPMAPTRMKDVLFGLETPSKPFDCGHGIFLPSKNVVGWFDLDNLAWFFRDRETFFNFSAIFDVYKKAPQLDENLDYHPAGDLRQAEAAHQMQRLADIWRLPVALSWNGQPMNAAPKLILLG